MVLFLLTPALLSVVPTTIAQVVDGVPEITGFSPGSGDGGTVVEITGRNLTNVTAIYFLERDASGTFVDSHYMHNWNLVDDGNITVVIEEVPAEKSYKIVLSTSDTWNAAESVDSFAVTIPSGTTYPVISGFSPTSGPANMPFKVFGSNLTGVDGVWLYNSSRLHTYILHHSDITVLNDGEVEFNASWVDPGNYSVTLSKVNGTVATESTSTIELTAETTSSSSTAGHPEITGFSPLSGHGGTIVTITGRNFTNVTHVKFAEQDASGYPHWMDNWNLVDDGNITVVIEDVPAEKFYTIALATADDWNAAQSTESFQVTVPSGATYPVISGFNPDSGPAGTVFKVLGSNLTDVDGVSLYNSSRSHRYILWSGDINAVSDTEVEFTAGSWIDPGNYTVTVSKVNGTMSTESTSTIELTSSSTTTSDADSDGYTVEAGDCDDSNPSVYPGAPELVDGIDNDCNGVAEPSEFAGLVTAVVPTRSDGATFGMVYGATAGYDSSLDAGEPPAPPEDPWVRAFFSEPANAVNLQELDTSIYAIAEEAVWNFSVQSDVRVDSDGDGNFDAYPVDLAWAATDFSAIAADYVVFLEDPNTGTSLDMTSVTSYQYTVPENAYKYTHEMYIVLVPRAPNLEVTDIKATTPAFGADRFVEGHTTTVSVNVTNIGTQVASSYGVTFYVDGNAQETRTLGPLDYGAKDTIDFSWTPTNVRGNHDLRFAVHSISPSELVGDAYQNDNVLNVTAFVEDYEINVDGNPSQYFWSDIAPRETASYAFTISNDGNMLDTVSLVESWNKDPNWTVTVEALQTTLQPGKNTLAWLNVSAPKDAVLENRYLSVTLNVTSTTDAQEASVVYADTRALPTWEKTLNEGWHMVSLPVDPRATDASKVFSTVDSYQSWNGIGYETPTTVSKGVGYWVYVPTDATRTLWVPGNLTYETGDTYTAGWHMIGGPTHDATAAVSGSADGTIYTWAGTQYAGQDFTQPGGILHGTGYWFLATADGTTVTIR